MTRIHLPRERIRLGKAVVEGEEAHYLRRVLRLGQGDEITVFDGEGRIYKASIVSVEEGRLHLAVGEGDDTPPERSSHIVLLQGLPKGDKMEQILCRCTELGFSRLVPVETRRAILRLHGRRAVERTERWRTVAREASRQCGRFFLPTVDHPLPLSQALREATADLKLILYEDERATGLTRLLQSHPTVSSFVVLVGPEGGFESEEVELARSHGFIPVSLGPRILRVETAGPAVVAVLQFLRGDLGMPPFFSPEEQG